MKTPKTWAAAAAMVTLTGAAQAALIDRGGGMIYDSTLKYMGSEIHGVDSNSNRTTA